jgi:MarR family 2-MHQ and catechol resistance regulon transcriptional repressor
MPRRPSAHTAALPPARRRSYGAEADRALDLWVALARCAASVGRVSARDIQRYGLTQAQFAVLEVLHHKGPMPLCSIGEKLLVTSGNVTFVADQLEKAGWLRRQRSTADRRVTIARLTPRGEALMERCFPQHAVCIEEAARVLPPKEQAALARLLKKWGKAAAGR